MFVNANNRPFRKGDRLLLGLRNSQHRCCRSVAIHVDVVNDLIDKSFDLWGANLEDANLIDALLFDANLRDANLQDALLSGAMLNKANLRHADLTGADLDNAFLGGAIMPDGSVHD